MFKDDLPAPLTGPDCDLQGYAYMPLFGHKLFNSTFNDKATDAEFRIAITLWWTAWQQVPAGSLPNVEHALCKLAGLGKDLRAWRRVKETVLHGFVLCNDGRLYHPLICNEALVVSAKRKKERERKAEQRAADKHSRRDQDIDIPDFVSDCPTGHTTGRPADEAWDVQGKTTQHDSTQESVGVELDSSVQLENITEQTTRATTSQRKPDTFSVEVKNIPRFVALGLSLCPTGTRGRHENGREDIFIGAPDGSRYGLFHICRLVAQKLNIAETEAVDWSLVATWLTQGYRYTDDILPVITQARSQPSWASVQHKLPYIAKVLYGTRKAA